ncbi:MAG TPA: hypothetical protein PKB01_09415 [Xanthobacteraceae bacterium]|nr:hypothetical protein [Xanthobacteraceae bacterium]
MSKSRDDDRPFQFNTWIAEEFRESGAFTALVLLVSIGNLEVTPLRSTFLHVIGDEVDWIAFSTMMRGANVEWDGAMLMPVRDNDGGPLEDESARTELRALEKRVVEDRMILNEGHFFDKWGRRMKIEEATAQ